MSEDFSRRTLAPMIGLLLGPLLALAVWGWMGTGVDPEAVEAVPATQRAMAAVATWMAVWWLTDAIPLAATALLPLVLFPLLGILPADRTAACYGDNLIFLFLGGFLIGLGVERSGLHRRVALMVVARVGDNPRLLVLGFMLATAVLSMWISNTATTLLLLPIAASVLLRAEESAPAAPQQGHAATRRLGVALMLGIGYSASIGGVATLVGTPTNVAMTQLFENRFPLAPQISFGAWLLLALPFTAVMLTATWAMLVFVTCPLGRSRSTGAASAIQAELARLGPMDSRQWRMVIVFACTALLWIFREPVPDWGWAPLLGWGKTNGGTLISDTTVALAMALLCFVIPGEGWRGSPLLTWQTTSRLPWGVLLLFGGGLALAQGMEHTGLAKAVAGSFAAQLDGQSPWVLTAATAVGMTYLTELVANISCVQLSLPILFSMAEQIGCDPRLLMIPATLAANCAFMMPVATPPNAIVFASGRVQVSDMIRAGFWLNLIGIFIIVTYMLLVAGPLWGMSWHQPPDWLSPAAAIGGPLGLNHTAGLPASIPL